MIGIIGGTFDPIHLGHLRPALEIAEIFSFNELRFIPSANPPHRWKPEASAEHRLEMVKLATKNEPVFNVDDREYHREGPSFTIDTIRSIRNEIGNEHPLCMIIGLDAFQSFTKWRDWQNILELTHLLVSSRPGYDQMQKEQWADRYRTENVKSIQQKPSGHIYFIDVTQLDISATFIREQIKLGNSSRYLTTHAVHEYLLRNELYETK